MSKEELNTCLKYFYTSARKQDGSYYKATSLKSIRSAIDRYLRSPPHSKQFSIISDAAFTEANRVLYAFVKNLKMTGKIEGVVHRQAITKEQVQKLFDSGQLGPANSQDPSQLQRTVWFYLGLYFGRRGREDQRDLKSGMLSLRRTLQGVEYFELDRQLPGRLSLLTDVKDESDVKAIFSVAGSSRCPVMTIKNYLSHLNPASDVLFQRPIAKYKPKEAIWYGPATVGRNALAKFMKEMSTRAGIEPCLTKHCLGTTAVSILSHRNCPTIHVTAETPVTSCQAISSHFHPPCFAEQQHISVHLNSFLGREVASDAKDTAPPGPKVIATMIEIEQQQNSGGEIVFQVRKIPIVQQPNPAAVFISSSNNNVAHNGGQINPTPAPLFTNIPYTERLTEKSLYKPMNLFSSQN